MSADDYKVIVAKDLEDLIPVFMSNRHKELDSLRVALAAADFEQLRQLGHRMKGVGNSYGFNAIVRRSASTSRTARAAATAPRCRPASPSTTTTCPRSRSRMSDA